MLIAQCQDCKRRDLDPSSRGWCPGVESEHGGCYCKYGEETDRDFGWYKDQLVWKDSINKDIQEEAH